ncbi:hypothetical protein CEXT_760401 [Caerostris extrusa]|uniref:Uncharacterized protein n=1 Tax=Caerostris extrusa TaxID=172846 RepID=A0AAV4TDZ4_CAEEX|nr:hypothetical protein CEXT_760401 [Caerostris extrusa]
MDVLFLTAVPTSTRVGSGRGYEHHGTEAAVQEGRHHRVCGRMLVDTLSLLCNGEYYDPSEDRISKRNSLTQGPYLQESRAYYQAQSQLVVQPVSNFSFNLRQNLPNQ